MHLDPKEFSLIPTGSYPATIQSLEEAEGKFGPQFRWMFDLGRIVDVDEVEDEKLLVGYTGQELGSKSKLWAWVAATGLDPAEGIDTEDLIGRRVVLDVTIEPRKDGLGEYNAIHGLRRPKAKPAKAGAKPVEDDDDGPF